MKTIILNAMFAGDYGENNIDGEIINFYLDDRGVQNYFVSEYGYIPQEILNDEIVGIFMVYKIDGYTFEIIGKYETADANYVANDLIDDTTNLYNYIESNRITYSNVSLNQINNGTLQRKFSTISFRGGKVFFPKKRLIITSHNAIEIARLYNVEQQNVYHITNEKWGSKNFRIFSANDDLNQCFKNANHIVDNNNIYITLNSIFNLADFWQENSNKVNLDFASLQDYRNIDYLGLNHIINGSHIELLSSNWLAHYIGIDPMSFLSFFGINNPGSIVSVKREYNNIDILVEFQNNVVVIENKIKADIELNTGGTSCQLEKYFNIIEREFPNKQKTYMVLCPDFRKKIIEDQINGIVVQFPQTTRALRSYDIKTYSDLKTLFIKNHQLSGAKYYTEFLDFLDDNSNYSQHYKRKKLSEKRLKHYISINL